MRRLFLLPLLLVTLAAGEPLLPGEDPVVVGRWVEHMRNNFQLGSLPDGKPLPVETPAARAKPIVAPELAKRIWDRGVLSGKTETCGGDWKVMSFDPLMAELRARGDLSALQLGFAALLHGAAQQQGRGILEEDCTPDFKAALSATLRSEKSRKV